MPRTCKFIKVEEEQLNLGNLLNSWENKIYKIMTRIYNKRMDNLLQKYAQQSPREISCQRLRNAL